MDMSKNWKLLILDAYPQAESLSSTAVGDLDGDGKAEIVVGGSGGLLWYRPETFERGIIAKGDFGVGIVLEDIDNDGIMEVVTGDSGPLTSILWFKPGGDISKPWTRYKLCSMNEDEWGNMHDLLFIDIDKDGEKELIAVCVGVSVGVYIYKRKKNLKEEWTQYPVIKNIMSEGLSVGDINNDGRFAIISGPYWCSCPKEGPLSGMWEKKVFAHSFREMCRTALVDITGNGCLDIVITESEFVDGKLSWFENHVLKDPDNPWVEHVIDKGLVFAHSLGASRDTASGKVKIFLGEMAQGGYNAPYNHNARLIEYTSCDNGKTWQKEIIYHGTGTHEAVLFDIDGDGVCEIIGKKHKAPKVQVWKKSETPSPVSNFRHRMLDRDKPYTAIDILSADIDGDGLADVVCGAWWYKNPTWERRDIPGIYQVVNAFDIDKDGRIELIATKKKRGSTDWYGGLSSEFCWLKPVDALKGEWREYPINTGTGDWPHGTCIAPVLPGEKLALIVGYHSSDKNHFPEIFEIPDNPEKHPWKKKVLAEIPYGEEFTACDINVDGKIDIVAGNYWLENLGNGKFQSHKIIDNFPSARVRVADINKDGRPDIILGEEALDFKNRTAPVSRLVWLENPKDPSHMPWKMHVIDRMRCPHSLDLGDIDGDGELEIVCGEHDPFSFWPYRGQCKLFVYKKAEPKGRSWFRYLLDNRFEHHDGTKIFEVSPGHMGIISHGWIDSLYVHLWEQV